MESQLPALQIVVPLVAAPLCVLFRRRGAAWVTALTASALTFAISIALLTRTMREGAILYEFGGWAVPYGIGYRIDVLSAFMVLFVSGLGILVLLYAPASLAREIPRDKHYLFLTLYMLCLAGLLGILVTGDLFNLFVFLEISSLSSYALISLGRTPRAFTAAFQYLIMGTVGATFYLIGVGFLYMMTGTLNMMDMASRLADVEATRTVIAAFGFITVGIALKMALFPLHVWLPNAYAYAPSVVTAFLAATATKVSVYILIRIVFTVCGPAFIFGKLRFDTVLLPLALLGIFSASAVAIFQRDIKRMLAYSSVAQIGYMALGISFASATGLTGGIVHMFNHALTKGALFCAMGCIALRIGSVHIDDLHGIGRRMPLTMFAWVLGGLSLIGVPLTAGFISKWYLIAAALETGRWPIAALVLLSSLLALVYVWRVVEVAYFRTPPENAAAVHEAPLSMLVPTWALILAVLFFGISTTLSAGIAQRAAELLLAVGR
ncbi:MAG: monovalent cation/H+ antiporter subunit D family protein [bacterium]|nr:monovalent cation/H+ antiporter subunit D family protein [bacterium]